ALVSFTATLMLTLQFFEVRSERGVTLLAASAIWGLVTAALASRRLPDLALAVGAAALALGAIGTADLLSDSALTIAWAGQALVLVWLARRLGDARLQAMGLVYVVLAGISALAGAGRLEQLFDEQDDQLSAVIPLAAVAAAAIGGALLIPSSYRTRTESG